MTPKRYSLSMTADEVHTLKTALDMGLTAVPESLMIRVKALADRARLTTMADDHVGETNRTTHRDALAMFKARHTDYHDMPAEPVEEGES